MSTEEFTFSRDYRGMFAVALKESNIPLMQRLFEQLADEVGLENPQGDKAAEAFAKEAAQRLNAMGKGGPGRKV